MRARPLETEARDRFVRDTADHVMEVLHDDGEYRHLRFKNPDTITYYFDLVVWPGNLTITGDCGTFVFSRTRDMFAFFLPEGRDAFDTGINPQYWSEKLQAPKADGAEAYSYKTYQQYVREWRDSVAGELEPVAAASLREAVDERLLGDWLDAARDEHGAHMLLQEFEHDGIRVYDAWEWKLREYRWDFLWCCWAIVYGIHHYRMSRQREPVAS